MNLFTAQSHGAHVAERYRREADVARMLSLAPRRRAGRPTLARALRSLAQGLAGYADRLDPANARTTWRGRATARNAN
jgi:hypothetical protein